MPGKNFLKSGYFMMISTHCEGYNIDASRKVYEKNVTLAFRKARFRLQQIQVICERQLAGRQCVLKDCFPHSIFGHICHELLSFFTVKAAVFDQVQLFGDQFFGFLSKLSSFLINYFSSTSISYAISENSGEVLRTHFLDGLTDHIVINKLWFFAARL